MVRETRHLWVGNLPDNVSKERIKEYFNRYGPVQSVKPLPGQDGKEGDGAGAAHLSAVTVAFMDIKSACKALQTTHKLDERLLKTDFYDPASGACGSGSCPPTPEEKGGGPGGGGALPGGQQGGKLEHGRVGGPAHFYRGDNRDNRGYQSQARYEREGFNHRSRQPYRNGSFNQDGGRPNAGTYRNSYGWKDSRAGRAEQSQYPAGPGQDKQEPARLAPGKAGLPSSAVSAAATSGAISCGKKQRARKSKSSESGSDSQQSGSNSRSSSSSSSRSSSSASGSSKSPSPERSGGRLNKRPGLANLLGNYLPHTEFDKQCTVVVRNLPERPAESLVKEELAREYKKGGCVVRDVRVVDKKSQAGTTRTAVITFSDPADVSKALEDSRNKRILGSLIDVEKLNSHSDDRPRDGEYSEFHPKATRTLFVGNISREVVPSEIHERFKEFGEILEIDIKKPDYALVQFVDIKSVVKAMRGMGGEMIAGQRVRLGFGLSVATKCVWCDGVGAEVTEKMLQVEFSQYGKIQDLIVDRSRGHALVYFDQLKKATIAVKEVRGRSIMGCRLQTDYASHECRAAFFDHCKKSGMDIRERAKPWEQEQDLGDKRSERGDRKPRERSNESRGSGASRAGRKRDEYDEELRRFQNERGKFDETERCFTPPYSGARVRGVPSTGGPSRSPSPLPRSSARSPGQLSRSGHDRSSAAFSDRESVVSDGSRHGSPVSRDNWRGSRYKPRVQAISPPGDSRSPADHDDSRRGSKRYREEERRGGGRGALPTDPRVDHSTQEKKHFRLLGVDSGLSEETSSGSSGSVPDVDNAKLPGRTSSGKTTRRTSTDSASASMDGHSRPTTPGLAYPPASALLRVATQDHELHTAPRTPVSPPPSSDGSRPGTPLCDENPENLMSRTAAAPVRLASHLRTQNNSSEPMSLPLPRFAQHVLSTSPGERPPRSLQISPRDSRPEPGPPLLAPAAQPGMLKHPRPDLAKLSIMSPTKYPPTVQEPRARDPRLKSPSMPSPSMATAAPLKSPVSVPGGVPKAATFLSPGSSTLTPPVPPKDPRPGAGLLALAVPTVVTNSPMSPLPRLPRLPQEPELLQQHQQQLQQQQQQQLQMLQQQPVPESKTSSSDPDDLQKRLKILDEKYKSWSNVSCLPGSGSNRQEGSRFNLDIKPAQPSAIVQKLLSRKSVFDEDSKRLENITEKYDATGEGSEVGEAAGYSSLSSPALKPGTQSPSLSADSPISSADNSFSSFPGTPPMKAVSHRPPTTSPRLYHPQEQKMLEASSDSSRPLPLPYRAGTPATMGTNPIKPLADKLSKPAAFTKPSATVTPTLKSTGLTASTSVRSNVFTTTSTKTVSTCTMAPGSHIGVEKGEASSTTCSPKPSEVAEVSSSLVTATLLQETDSDPNVTSTTGTEHKKKQEANRDIRTMKKELDSLSHLKEKRDMGEELLFAPSATIMQSKSKYDKKDKKSTSSTHDILKDVQRAKEMLHKDKIKSNREKKDKMKVKQNNDLKDFLSATATIRKEAKREKEEKREQGKKPEPKIEEKPVQKRRLSSNSEIEEAEPKSKIPKLKPESECEPEVKKIKTEPMTPMGRIPKLAKKEEKKERTDSSSSVRPDGSKDRSKSSYSKSDSRSKSRHEERHGHRLASSGDKTEERKKDKHKKKKKEKDKDRDKDDKSKKHDKSKSRSHSSDDERHHKKMKKSKDSKKKDGEKERTSSKSDKKDKIRDKEKDRSKEKTMTKEEREKERARRRHMEMVEEQKKMFEALRRKKKLENGESDSDGNDSSGDETNFSIFDEPVFDENNPAYFSMYDKVKARRSCVKAKEEELARRQEEALNKFAKLKAQRAKREGKKVSMDSDDDSMDDDEGHLRLSSPLNSDDGASGGLHMKNSSLLNSSSDSEVGMNGQMKRDKKSKSGNTSNEERKRSFKSSRPVVDSSDDSSPSGSRKPLGKPNPGLDSSETDEHHDEDRKADAKPKKLHIYSDSESDLEADKKVVTSEGESKAAVLAVLAMNKKKELIKQEVKNEPVSSEDEGETILGRPILGTEDLAIKKEIKTEDGTDQKQLKKKAHVKKEKKRDKETKEISKEKSLLGQKLKMAKIFGTSSEDEGNCRNSKPPTPNTSVGKTSLPKVVSKKQKLRVEHIYSDSETEKRQDSPALMSDSDDDVPSRPPTPSLPTPTKTEIAKPAPPTPKEAISAKAEESASDESLTKPKTPGKDETVKTVFNESSEEEQETKKDYERNRRLSAHDRQKESENLFDSLLTVNVDLPSKSSSWKSPGGSLKSPSVKSPGKSSVSPGSGSHKSPLISPGGKPTYLLAHMFGGDRSAREAEKIHRAQEREMHKKGSDRISKETFKTKKDFEESPLPKKQEDTKPASKEEMKPAKSLVDTPVEVKILEKCEPKVLEKVERKIPEKVERKIPEKVERKIPEKVERKIPEKVERKILEKVERKIPEMVEQKIPEKMDQKKPEKLEQNLPEKVEQKTLEKVEQKILEKVEHSVSEKVELKALDKVELKALEKVELKALDKVEQKALNKVEHASLAKVELKALEKAEHKVLEKVEHKVLEKVEHKVLEEVEHKVLEKVEHKVLEKVEHMVLEKVERKLLEKADNKALQKVDHKALQKVELKPLEKVEHKVLEKVEHKVLEKVEHMVLEKVDQKALEKVEHKVLEKVEHKNLEKVEHKNLEKVKQNILEKVEHKVLEKAISNCLDKVERKVLEKVDSKSLVQPKEKKPESDSKDRKLGQHTEDLKKNSEVKLKDKERGGALSVTSNNSREEVENEPKGKVGDLSLKPPREEVRHRSKARTEETTTERKGRDKSKDEKKVAEVAEIKIKAKEASVRSSSVSKGKEEEQTKSGKKPAEVITLQSKHEKITPASPDSVFDFKDEVEVVETRENTVFEKLKPVLDAKSKITKVPEKPLEAAASQISSLKPAKPVGTDYASFAAQTKMEATSSSSPASEDDDTPLIIAVENEVTEVTQIDPDEPVIEDGGDSKSGPSLNSKQLKSSEPTEQEQLEKSIASITGDARGSDNPSDPSEADTFVPAPVEQKRTVISQEETENAINALLGESFESFEEPVEPSTVTRPVDSIEVGGDDEAASAVAGLAEDEAASAVLGLEMSPVDPWGNTNPAKQQEDESIENIAAEIRRSSTESARRLSSESKEPLEDKASVVEKCDKPRARILPPPRKPPAREEQDKPEPGKLAEDVETSPAISVVKAIKVGEDKEVRTGRKVFQTVDRSEVLKTHDVFDFKVEEEPLEPLKAIERPKSSTCSVDSVIEEVVKSSYEETTVLPTPAARVTLPRKPLATTVQPSSGPSATLVVQPSAGPSASLAVQPSSGPLASLAVQPSPANIVVQPSPVHSATKVLQPSSGLTARLVLQPSSVLPAKSVLQPGLPASLALQPIHVATSQASPPAQITTSPVVSLDSPLALQRLSVEDKASPPLPLLSSPNSAKSPRPARTRRSTGGKSRESEEESPDTLQKINLILEQAKQEAERSAHNQHNQGLQGYSQAPPHSQDILIDPKTGQVVARQAAPNSVTLTLVSSSPQELHQHPADLRVAVPRTGVPQPTVLPPRHEQQVRPGQVVARQVAAPARHAAPARPALPIQLPTQPLPPESVRKAQPVLLEQNQPSKLARALPLPVSLPTEPVPRSVAAASQLPSLPRNPLPFSSSGLVMSTGATALRLVTSQPIMSRAQVTPSWQPGAQARPQQPSQETGQRVSLNKRDKEPELEAKAGLSSEPVVPPAMKVGRDYLQPREREVLRPASTPGLSTPQPQQYEVPGQPHLTSTAAQYEADLLRLANYRDLTLIYNQLLTQGHPEHVAQNLAQSMVRERYEQYRPVHEEPRPGSVPPGMAMHHIEEIRRQQQIVQRQPLPAHSPQVDPYRQADSPHGAMYMGAHPYGTPHASHLDSYRRPGLGPEPPAAHSGQPVARLTQSPAVSDYSISRPSSPTYNTMSDYRLPHLAAYPICWSGTLGLKNDTANVRMHYVSGNRDLAKASLPDTGSSLKINQRMRLEDSQLDGVARKMETKSEHCMLLALPNGSEHEEIEHQSKILRSNFITYLQLKSAAGIVNVSNEDNQPAYIVHVFPSCDFANENLARIAPNLLHRVADIEHLVIVIATVFDVNR